MLILLMAKKQLGETTSPKLDLKRTKEGKPFLVLPSLPSNFIEFSYLKV